MKRERSAPVLAALCGVAAGLIALAGAQARPREEPGPGREVPSAIGFVVGEDASASYGERVAVLRECGHRLSRADTERLLEFLDRHGDQDPLRAEALHALKNEVVNVLRRQNPVPATLAPYLLGVYQDSGHGAAWRDYCLQHMGALYPRLQDVQRYRENAV